MTLADFEKWLEKRREELAEAELINQPHKQDLRERFKRGHDSLKPLLLEMFSVIKHVALPMHVQASDRELAERKLVDQRKARAFLDKLKESK